MTAHCAALRFRAWVITFRFTLPIATAPTFPDGETTGLGDLTLMDLFMFPGKQVSFGVGPMLVLPTATDDVLGAGKWQAGVAGIAVAPQDWGLLGGLVTYQHSFARRGRPPGCQPPYLRAYHLLQPARWFLPSLQRDMELRFRGRQLLHSCRSGHRKVFQLNDKTTMNAYVEPQYTVAHDGIGAPRWQIFAGMKFQFAIDRPVE